MRRGSARPISYLEILPRHVERKFPTRGKQSPKVNEYPKYIWQNHQQTQIPFYGHVSKFLCLLVHKLFQWSTRLGLHSRDRYRNFFFLGLKFETETETQIFGISRSRVWRDFFSDSFETETELFIFSRPRLRPRLKFSYFRDRDLDESQNRDFSRPRLFHYDF